MAFFEQWFLKDTKLLVFFTVGNRDGDMKEQRNNSDGKVAGVPSSKIFGVTNAHHESGFELMES